MTGRVITPGKQVQHEVAAGRLHAADAILDPRAQGLTLAVLLAAQPGWNRARAVGFLLAARRDGKTHPHVGPTTRIRWLTIREQIMLAKTLGGSPRLVDEHSAG